MLALVQLRRDVAACEGVPHPCAGEPEHLRERAQHDHAFLDQAGGRLARVLEVRLVDDERPRRRELAELARRIVRPAADRQHRVVIVDLGACDPHGDLEHRIGRVVRDRDPVSRTCECTSDEQDQVVRARTEDDVLRGDTGVVGDRLLEPGVAAVRIGVDAGQLLGKRLGPCRWQQVRRRVAVETDDLGDVEAGPSRDLLRRGRVVGLDLPAERSHARISCGRSEPARQPAGRTPG